MHNKKFRMEDPKMKMNVRKINMDELAIINEAVIRRFGANNRITSGSLEEVNGNRRYNIALEGSAYRPQAMLAHIGAVVKETLNCDEVFNYGIKLA